MKKSKIVKVIFEMWLGLNDNEFELFDLFVRLTKENMTFQMFKITPSPTPSISPYYMIITGEKNQLYFLLKSIKYIENKSDFAEIIQK